MMVDHENARYILSLLAKMYLAVKWHSGIETMTRKSVALS